MTNTTKNKNKPALGKGMGALLGASAELNKAKVAEQTKSSASKPETKTAENSEAQKSTGLGYTLVDIERVQPNKAQPRKIFKDKELSELSDSIKENGIIQPITVQEEDGRLTIIAGERRFRAAKLAGLKEVPITVKRAAKKDILVMSIIENVQREDLNCVEEALAYFQLMNEFNLTQEEVSKKIGKERSTIANFLRILKLPREVVSMLQKELLTFGHAKVLASLKDEEQQRRLAQQCVSENWSIRELEKNTKKSKSNPAIEPNPFFNEKVDSLKRKLEETTGFRFDIKTKPKGSGVLTIKYNNEAEFNDIFEYLLKR